MYRKFTFSCSIFGGYSTIIDIEEYKTIEEICKKAVKDLYNTLSVHTLYQLKNTLVLQKYHIHSISMKDIKNQEKEFYICNCKEC